MLSKYVRFTVAFVGCQVKTLSRFGNSDTKVSFDSCKLKKKDIGNISRSSPLVVFL